MEVALLPVFGEPGSVVADAVGEVVPEEVESGDESEVDGDRPVLLVHVGGVGPLGERVLPRAFVEERLQIVAAVLAASDLRVLVLVRVDGGEFGRLRRIDVEAHAFPSAPVTQNGTGARRREEGWRGDRRLENRAPREDTPPQSGPFTAVPHPTSDMELRDISRRVGIAAGVVTVLALAAPYAVLSGGSYASQLADYYASGVVGGAGIALFALLSVVVVASVERGNLDPGTLAGAAVVLGVATTLSAAAWATAIEPSPMFRDNLWLVWHARVVVALSVLIPVAAAAYARELLA